MIQNKQVNKCNKLCNGLKRQKSHEHLNSLHKKTFDKIQPVFLIKALDRVELEEMYFKTRLYVTHTQHRENFEAIALNLGMGRVCTLSHSFSI